jgi:hypothetical protein
MNYIKIYESLISRRKQHTATGYTENHHIIMRSMGGDDSDSNLVRLTGREHWVAHLLLYRIYRNRQTIFACHMMSMRCEERGIPFIKNSRMYEHIRKQHAKFMSVKNKISSAGKANSQYGTRWICNIETKENKKISKNDQIPENWIAGRNKWKIKKREKSNRFGKKLSEETKIKISIKNKISKIGNKSLLGRIWINDGVINKVILKEDKIPDGFIKGRI